MTLRLCVKRMRTFVADIERIEKQRPAEAGGWVLVLQRGDESQLFATPGSHRGLFGHQHHAFTAATTGTPSRRMWSSSRMTPLARISTVPSSSSRVQQWT